MDWVAFGKDNWAVIEQAPWAFVTALVLFGGGGLFFGRLWRSDVISSKTSIIELRDAEIADYKRKLDGASPDDAARRIEQLELNAGSFPIEELEHLTAKQAQSRQAVIRKLHDEFRSHNDDENPSEDWINQQLEKQGKRWRSKDMGSYWATYEPALWG